MHLDALPKTRVVEFSGEEFAEPLQGFGSTRKQVDIEVRVSRHANCTVVDPVLDPMFEIPNFSASCGTVRWPDNFPVLFGNTA